MPCINCEDYADRINIANKEVDKLANMISRLINEINTVNDHNLKLTVPGVYGSRMIYKLDRDIQKWWDANKSRKE